MEIVVDGGAGSVSTAASVPAVATATRQRVLAAVAAQGPTTAADLAHDAGLTPAAVRRHLDALVEVGHVEGASLVRTGGRGRPARTFTATDAGRAAVAGSLRGAALEGGDLALSALRQLRAHGGHGAIALVARDRASALARRHSRAVEAAGPDPASRARALAAALDGEGYAATARSVVPSRDASGAHAPGRNAAVRGATMVPSAVQLCQGSCPVRAVATEFPELCDAETEAFGVLLGTHVRRLATLAHGDHVCTTHVPLTRDGAPRRPADAPDHHQHHRQPTPTTGGTPS